MAPYNPPSAHYAHLNVSLYSPDMIKSYIGKKGEHFYNLTARLKVRYIWYNMEKKIIEIWGPYESFRDNKPVDVIYNELQTYKNVYEESISDTK